MSEERPEWPTLDAVVDDILHGRRVVLFPPGVFAFAGASLAFIIGSSLLCAMTLPTALAQIVHSAMAPLVGILLATAMLALAAFAVAVGKEHGRAVFAAMVASWLLLSCLFLLGVLGGIWPGRPVFALIPVCCLAGSLMVTYSSPFRKFTIFKRRLFERRRELLQRG